MEKPPDFGSTAPRAHRPLSRRRKAALRIVVPTAVIGIAVFAWWPRPEPTYQGKPISFWLDSAQEWIGRNPPASVPGQDFPHPTFKAKEALAAIGPEALPYIVARASGTPSGWSRLYSQFHRHLPVFLSRHLPKPRTGRGLPSILTSGYFLAVTERAGTNATPMLVKLYSSSNTDVRRAAILSLGRLAPLDHKSTLPVFESALRDSDPAVRFDAFRQLCPMAGTDSRAGIVLVTFLNEAGTNAPGWMRLEGMAAAGSAAALAKSTTNDWRLAVGTNMWEEVFAALADWQRSPTLEAKERALAGFEAACATTPEESQLNVRRALENLPLTAQQEKEILVPLLAKAIGASNSTIRAESASMLHDLGPMASTAAASVLQAFEKQPSRELFLLLTDVQQDTVPVGTLMEQLELARDEYAIWEATSALGKAGPRAREAGPTLLKMAREKNGDARAYLLSALAQIEPQTAELPSLLLTILEAEDVTERTRAASILSHMGLWASNVVPALKKVLLEDEWLEPRLEAATAIFRIDAKQGCELVPVLIEAIEWPEADGYPTAAIVARLLGQAGNAATPAVPELVKLFRHEDERACIAAAEALVNIQPERKPECIATLRAVMIHGRTGLMRFHAAKALWHMSPEMAGDIAAEIGALLKPSTEFYEQEQAIRFLGEMGPPAHAAIPQLREMLESRDWKLRRAARDTIERIQPGAGNTTTKD